MQEEVRQLIEELRHAVTRPWAVMEVCGGQTHAIASLGLEELLRTADLVSLHCPLTAETYHMINAETIQMMRDSAVLVSVVTNIWLICVLTWLAP